MSIYIGILSAQENGYKEINIFGSTSLYHLFFISIY